MASLQQSKTGPLWYVKSSYPSVAVIPLTKDCTVCGRNPDCDIVLDSTAVGRKHFQIHQRHGGCYLEDLYSRCGTFLHRGEGNNGRLRAECEIISGGWQVMGLTPLRADDVFGHPACFLFLKRATEMTAKDWTTGLNSQAMLLAVRGTPVASPVRLLRFLESCVAMLDEDYRVEENIGWLREQPDVWSAAAGLARLVIARTTSRLIPSWSKEMPPRQAYEEDLWRACKETELRLCRLLRELFRNPFGFSCLNPAWQTSTVLSLARAAYDESISASGSLDSNLLAVLADALEDAGCSDPDLLDHLRDEGPHDRWCWALKILLNGQ